MLHTLRGIRAFDTSAAFTGDRRPLSRFMLSIALLNFLPFLHFSIILLYFLQNLEISIYSVFVVFGLSIGIFGFDKIFHAILVRFRDKLYTEKEIEGMLNDGYSGNDVVRRKFDCHDFQYLVPGLLYILVPLGFMIAESDTLFGTAVIFGSTIGSIFLWKRWRSLKEEIEKLPSISVVINKDSAPMDQHEDLEQTEK